jgi:hypothetical protein
MKIDEHSVLRNAAFRYEECNSWSCFRRARILNASEGLRVRQPMKMPLDSSMHESHCER